MIAGENYLGMQNHPISGPHHDSYEDGQARIRAIQAAAQKAQADFQAELNPPDKVAPPKRFDFPGYPEHTVKTEAEVRQEDLQIIRGYLDRYQEMLPFLPQTEGEEMAFPMPDGSRVLMVNNNDRILIMQTTDPDKKCPPRHYHDLKTIYTPDVICWQIVCLTRQDRKKEVNSLFAYPRHVLDEMRDGKRGQGWFQADPYFNESKLEEMSTAELNLLVNKLAHYAIDVPEALSNLKKEHEQRVDALMQKVTAVREIGEKYGQQVYIKIVGKDQWLYFKGKSIYIFNKPDANRGFASHSYPVRDIDLDVQANPENTMGPGYVMATDVGLMKDHIREGKISVSSADFYQDQYATTVLLREGMLKVPEYEANMAALQTILDLELEEPGEISQKVEKQPEMVPA